MNACCEQPENLEIIEQRPGGITQRRCKVCQRNHYEMEADAGKFFAKGNPLTNGHPVRIGIMTAETLKHCAELARAHLDDESPLGDKAREVYGYVQANHPHLLV